MGGTKQKILATALGLFNRFGYTHIRMQLLADEAGLSVGNLAYHFKNQEVIFETLYNDLQKRQEELLAELRIVPLFENMDALFDATYELQQTYQFFYSETFELLRLFPEIKWKYRSHCRWFVQQLENLIQFNQARGAFVAIPAPQRILLAEHCWMALHLWLYQARLRGEEVCVQKFKEMNWAIFLPFLSEIGWQEYKQLGTYKNYNWL